jgi:hypothetical protein
MGKDNKKRDAKSENRWRTGQLNDKERKAMKRYGLDSNDYAFEGQSYRHQKGSYSDMKEDFLRAASNDYDTRRGIEAMAMSGKKKAEKIAKNGFMNPGDVMNANNMQAKEHRRAGNGGDFASRSDFAGTSYRSVQRDRDKQTAAYDEKYASKDDLKDLKKAKSVDEQVEEAQYEPSEKIKQAKERVAGYKEGVTADGDGDEQRANAASSYEKYKLNLSTMK